MPAATATKPKLTYTKGSVKIEVPYVAVFVQDIKTIPPHFRTYDPATRVWTVFQPHVATARKITRTYFPDAEEVNINNFQEEQRRQQQANEEFKRRQEQQRRQQEEARKRRQEEDTRRRNQQWDQYGNHYRNTGYQHNTGYNSYTGSQGRANPADPYSILFVTANAPQAVIEASYRALSKLYHPDKNHGSDEKMKQLNQAFDRIKGKR